MAYNYSSASNSYHENSELKIKNNFGEHSRTTKEILEENYNQSEYIEILKRDINYLEERVKTEVNLRKELEKNGISDKPNNGLQKKNEELEKKCESIQKNYETELSLREEFQENLKVVRIDNENKRKECEETRIKFVNLDKEFKKYVSEATDFMNTQEKILQETKNAFKKVAQELEEEKKKCKCFEIQRNEFRTENQKMREELNAIKALREEKEKINSDFQKELSRLKEVFRNENSKMNERSRQEVSKVEEDLNREKLRSRELEIQNDIAEQHNNELLRKIEIEKNKNRLFAVDNEDNKKMKENYNNLKLKIEQLKKDCKKFEKKTKYYKTLNEENKRKLLATEVSRDKKTKNYKKTIKKLREASQKIPKEYQKDVMSILFHSMNNITRKYEITNKRQFDNIENESQRNEEIDDEKSRKIAAKQKDNSVHCSDCNRSFTETGNCRRHLTRTHKLTGISLFDVPSRTIDDRNVDLNDESNEGLNDDRTNNTEIIDISD